MPLPAQTTSKPHKPRPLDELADQRGLIAVGERVDDAGRLGATREQRPDEGVRLDVDHHDVPAGLDRAQGMVDARRRIPRRLDHDLDARRGDQPGVSSVSQVVPCRCASSALRAASAASGQPAAISRSRTQARREVGDADDVDAGRAPRLRQVERPEDAAADHRHADRAPGGRAFLEPSQQRPRLHAGIIARRAAPACTHRGQARTVRA